MQEQEESISLPAVSFCKNCHNEVGNLVFCPSCGQKSDTHVLKFRELLEELADGLFNMDSRLWRTLVPLAVHPGKLTNEYLHGKRMHYLPPFRLYLILSVLFFLIPTFNFSSDDAGSESGQEVVSSGGGNDTGDEALPIDLPAQIEAQVGGDLGAQIAAEVRQELAAATEEEEFSETLDGSCELSDFPQDALTTAIIRNACLKLRDNPDQLSQAMRDSIPVMMVIGIPLVALLMLLFYASSGRYFVEHIIFLFHAHAFYFLIGIAMSLSSLLGQRYAFLFTPMDWFRIIGGFYIPLYIFLAMLNVYGESKGKTLVKAFFLMIGYGISIGIVMAFGFLFTALTF